MTLIDFRYKEFKSIVTAFAVAPTQRGRSIVWLVRHASSIKEEGEDDDEQCGNLHRLNLLSNHVM